MSRGTVLILVGVVALFVVLIGVVAVLAVQLARGPVAASPDVVPTETLEQSAEPSVTPEETDEPTPDPTPEPSADVREALAAIEADVLDIRGLPPAEIPPAELMTRDELQDELVELFAGDYPEEEQFADNVTLYAMGLLDADQDIAEIELQLLALGVLGFYDDEDKRIAVVTDLGLDAEAQMTYAHEYTHALQDENFGVAALELDVAGDDDGALARLSLLEGDAELTAYLWASEHLDPADQFGAGGPPPDLSGIPDWLIQSIIFPYTVGTDFVATVWQDGGFEAVDAAYAAPPESTEQVIHPDLYFADEQPVVVQVADLGAYLGEGWQQVESTPIGEATIDITLGHLGVDSPDASVAAAGWGGDRLNVAAGPEGAFALAWRLAWDSAEDADEFEAAYSSALDALDFPAAVTRVDATTVFIGHASEQGTLDAVMSLASP